MENKIQKSVKMDARVVAKIEEIVKSQRYWKFNAVVNQLLLVMVDGINRNDVYNVLRYWPSATGPTPKISINWNPNELNNEKD